MQRSECEICGDAAVFHETSIEAGLVSRHHFCKNHGDRIWLNVLPSLDEEDTIDDFKLMLVDELERDSELIDTELSEDEVRQRIENAQSLAELFAVLRRR